MNHKDWDLVNRRLVAKMLSELEYEQVFHAESQGDDRYCINLPGAQWRFIAERGIWGWLWIDAQTLRCADEPVLAQTLLMQLKQVLSMSDATVAEHMQDLYATLLGDLQLLKARRGLSASDLINLNADRLQCLLSGHPKFVFNKGRRGWGKEALERYAPEYANTFRLHWLAVKREHMIWRCDNEMDIHQLLTAAMDPQEFARFSQVWQENGLDHNCRRQDGVSRRVWRPVARPAVAAYPDQRQSPGRAGYQAAADHLQHLMLPGDPWQIHRCRTTGFTLATTGFCDRRHPSAKRRSDTW